MDTFNKVFAIKRSHLTVCGVVHSQWSNIICVLHPLIINALIVIRIIDYSYNTQDTKCYHDFARLRLVSVYHIAG